MEKLEHIITLTDLPDAIFQHIISFLSLKDIARLRVLCRRFQILSITPPSLYFNEYLIPHDRTCSCTHVSNFMNTLVQHRPHALTIKELCFSSVCLKEEHIECHINWINKLFDTFNVDELHLVYQLPSIFRSIPRFQSLKSLVLHMKSQTSVKLPCQMKLATLEYLYMASFETEDSIGEWVSQSLPSLKKLKLYRVTQKPPLPTEQSDLTIRSSSLEHLRINYCYTFNLVRIITEKLRTFNYICSDLFSSHDEIGVEISAPNLQNIIWKGAPPRFRYDKVTFKSLQSAMFHELVKSPTDSFFYSELLEIVRHASRLHINTRLIEDLYGRKPSLSLGDNLRHLEIFVGEKFCSTMGFEHDNGSKLVDALTSFLERIPNLESLSFVGNDTPLRAGWSWDGWCLGALSKYKNTKWKQIKGVKKVIIKINCMMYDPFPLLIGLIYSSCVDLKEMTLILDSCLHDSVDTYLNSLDTAFTFDVFRLCWY